MPIVKSIKYETTETGELKVLMESYMDTFPFEYFEVVSKVEEIPLTISSILREFILFSTK